MNLTAWCGPEPQGTTDFGFAQAIAVERATRRGVRQRVRVAGGEQIHGVDWPFIVEDAVPVARRLVDAALSASQLREQVLS